MYQIRGKCCPIFLHPELLGSFNVSNFVFRTGENAAQILPTNLLGDSSYHIRGKCCPIFPHELFGVIPLFQSGGKAAQSFATKCLGSINVSFLCLEQGEMLPNFSRENRGVIPLLQSEGNAAQSNGKILGGP